MSTRRDATTRPAIDPLYQKGAEAVYNSYREGAVEAAKVAAEYGRWLVSSILLLHAGAITGLLTFMGSMAGRDNFDASPYAGAFWPFVAGIVAILLCGFVAWLNWSLVAASYEHYVRPWMLVDPQHFPSDTAPGGWKIKLTYFLPIFFGWISVACLIYGAYVVSEAMSYPKALTLHTTPSTPQPSLRQELASGW